MKKNAKNLIFYEIKLSQVSFLALHTNISETDKENCK